MPAPLKPFLIQKVVIHLDHPLGSQKVSRHISHSNTSAFSWSQVWVAYVLVLKLTKQKCFGSFICTNLKKGLQSVGAISWNSRSIDLILFSKWCLVYWPLEFIKYDQWLEDRLSSYLFLLVYGWRSFSMKSCIVCVLIRPLIFLSWIPAIASLFELSFFNVHDDTGT